MMATPPGGRFSNRRQDAILPYKIAAKPHCATI
jgi:hypothetical protein